MGQDSDATWIEWRPRNRLLIAFTGVTRLVDASRGACGHTGPCVNGCHGACSGANRAGTLALALLDVMAYAGGAICVV